ncbi:MAG TPA: threonine synthase [candidate division Zixibacteria bacterium]|nr:threonine synthase [candidate division Zixibacteria bacterium]
MTFATEIACARCDKRFARSRLLNLCDCGSPLLVSYDLEKAKAALARSVFENRAPSLWRYRELLPLEDDAHLVSLGEGFTPLLEARQLARALGLRRLLIKDEARNPTGSFKDRGLSVAISRAKELGVTKAAIPSAGNAGGSLAAYAARAGIEAYIFMPRDAPPANRTEAVHYGARLTLVDGLISDCGRLIAEKKAAEGWFDVSTLKEPYRVEGKKTMGYEIAEQLGWRLPDVIIYPTGGGTGLIGMWKAFSELGELGWIGDKRPRMVSVQAGGCAPIVRAFARREERAEPWAGAKTIAAGLRVPQAVADFLILRAIYASNGTALSVGDEEMLSEIARAGRTEGIFFCPEGAACIAALRRLLEQGWIAPDEEVLIFNTASGLKYLDVLPEAR